MLRPPSGGAELVAAAYSSSVTWLPQVASSSSHIARWLMKWSGRAPCQCSSPGGVCTVSPGRIMMTRSRVATTPMPSVTWSVWPRLWLCQAVRAHGAKRTVLTRIRDWLLTAGDDVEVDVAGEHLGRALGGGLLGQEFHVSSFRRMWSPSSRAAVLGVASLAVQLARRLSASSEGESGGRCRR